MAWYDRFLGINREETEEKLNPSQYVISRNEGMTIDSREIVTNYRNAYEDLEVVNRAVNMIVDDVAEIPSHEINFQNDVRDVVAAELKALGFEDIRRLAGGMAEWTASNLPLVKK